MESFECREKDFEVDVLRDREPLELLKDRSTVFTAAGASEETGRRVLDIPYCLTNAIAVVNSACNEGMTKGFNIGECERWAESNYVLEVEECNLDYLFDVGFK